MSHRLKKLKFSFHVCYLILSGKAKHWTFIHLNNKEFVRLFCDMDYRYQRKTVGMGTYMFYKLIKKIADDKSDTEMIADKGTMTAEWEEYEPEEPPREKL